MSCVRTTITVYNGYSNTCTVVFGIETAGVLSLYDFSTATRMVLRLYDENDVNQATVDTDDSSDAMDWSGGDGEVVFDLGGESIDAGSYQAQLAVYDPSDVLPKLLVDDGEVYTMNVEVI